MGRERGYTDQKVRRVSGGASSWGSITGTLSAQTDLQSALDSKLAVSTAAATYQPLDDQLTPLAVPPGCYISFIVRPFGTVTSNTMTVTGTVAFSGYHE